MCTMKYWYYRYHGMYRTLQIPTQYLYRLHQNSHRIDSRQRKYGTVPLVIMSDDEEYEYEYDDDDMEQEGKAIIGIVRLPIKKSSTMLEIWSSRCTSHVSYLAGLQYTDEEEEADDAEVALGKKE